MHRPFYWLSPRHSMERSRYPRKGLTHQHCCLRQGIHGLVRAMMSNLGDTKLSPRGRRLIIPLWSRRLACFSPLETELDTSLIMRALALKQESGLHAYPSNSSSKDSGDKGHQGSFTL